MPNSTSTQRSRWRPATPARTLGPAAVALAGVLAAILGGTDHDLHGDAFVALVGLGMVAGLAWVEAAHRSGGGRVGLVGVGVLTGAGTLAAALTLGSTATDGTVRPRPPLAHSPLRVVLTPADPGFVYDVAFRGDLPRPHERPSWRSLIAAGGVDVGTTLLRMTLANRSRQPLTITDIRPQVVSAGPAPRETLVGVSSQGGDPLDRFHGSFDTTAPGSVALLFGPDEGDGTTLPRPYFETHYIALRPGEIYEAVVRIGSAPGAAVRFRMAIRGSTPDRSFSLLDTTTFQVSDDIWKPWHPSPYVRMYFFRAAS